VSLEQFRTQVLLLHSEQSTLDQLSSGFNDRYTVHCATSGSEALNTLGDTPIHVIVTAQDLPGMSGLDALREARKRSPDTIGILLAGNQDDGLEALVGDQEVFQVVRGGVTSDSLLALIDNATRQARLLALAESANDTAANVDIPATEHIVMETSENGSAMISDGTGRMPALNPKRISSVGSRAVDVLVLTKDEEFLTTIKDSSRGLHNVHCANTVVQADEAVRKYKIGVAVVDAAVVGSNIEELTLHLRTTVPRLVAIVAGRRDDGEMLMDLINRGKVYRFLLKPVSPGRARLAVEASVKHHVEAPDAAFIYVGKKAPDRVQPTEPAKPEPTPKARPARQTKGSIQTRTKSELQPERRSEPQVGPATNPVAEPLSVIEVSDTADRLSGSIEGSDKDFPLVTTGIVKSIGASYTGIRNSLVRNSSTSTPESGSDGTGGSLFRRHRILGIGAAALLVVASLGFWVLGDSGKRVASDEPLSVTPSITPEADLVIESPEIVAGKVARDELVDEARRARAAGQIFNPPGSNAIELYMAASATVPDDAVIAYELNAVIQEALANAESALLERRNDDAEAALQRVALADSDNARLPFLTAQFAQLQLRDLLDDARIAIRETRYEDAALALSGARALNIADATDIDLADNELSAARSQQQVDEVLAQAASRLADDKLTVPSNDNARYFYELVLSNDPENTAALQGLSVIASRLVLQARTQIDRGNFNTAEALLVDVSEVDPSSSALAESSTALIAAREREARALREEADRQEAADRRAAEQRAAEQMAAEQRAEEQRAEALRIANAQQAAVPATANAATGEMNNAMTPSISDELAGGPVNEAGNLGDIAAATEARATTGQSETQELLPAKPRDDLGTQDANNAASDALSSESADEVGSAGDTSAATAAPATTDAAAIDVSSGTPIEEPGAQNVLNSDPVPVSSLTRRKYVAPKYPRVAERRSISGWVDVIFTVGADGKVKDIAVRDSQPGETFVNAATKAVAGWEFAPVVEDGLVVERRAAVRMLFAVE